MIANLSNRGRMIVMSLCIATALMAVTAIAPAATGADFGPTAHAAQSSSGGD